MVTGVLVFVASFSLEAQSEVRAYVGGEGHWSKGQKDAIHSLIRYAATRDEARYQRFKAGLAVPLGDRRALEELDKPDFDFAVVEEGFVAGGNSPEDVRGLTNLYRRFGRLDYFARCFPRCSQRPRRHARRRDAGAADRQRPRARGAHRRRLRARLRAASECWWSRPRCAA